MWVVTASYNDYDQYGDYFVAVYTSKPNFHQLKKLLPNYSDATIGKLSRGGGRQDFEDLWFNLIEVEEGQLYHNV